MAGADFTVITGLVQGGVVPIVGAFMGIFALLVVVLVYMKGSAFVLSVVRGDKVLHSGKLYDKDVWQSAMTDLKKQERSGVALDAESRRALRKHQGMKF